MDVLNNNEPALLKSNVLINSKYQAGLIESRLIYLSLFELQNGNYKESNGNLVVTISVTKFKELSNNTSNNLYDIAKKAANNLMGIYFALEDYESQYFEYINMITRSSYNNITHEMTIEFNYSMKKYLLDLAKTGKFTLLNKITMMDFKSVYAFRLYEILRQYCYYGKSYTGKKDNIFYVTKNISELKFDLGVINTTSMEVKNILNGNSSKNIDYEKAENVAKDKKYETWDAFKRGCLDRAINEINNNPNDMYIEYCTKRGSSGKTIKNIEFKITISNNMIENAKRTKTAELIELALIFEKYNLNESDLISISKAANGDIQKCKTAKEILEKSNLQVNNVTAFIISAIKNNWELPKNSKKRYTDFKQRDYDFEQLEKEILSN